MAFDLQFVDSIGEIYAPITDTFTRTVANGLGTADTGQVWTVQAGAAAQFSVNGSAGLVAIDAVNTVFSATLAGSLDDYSVKILLSIDRLSAGNDIDIELLGGWQDVSNFYAYRLTIPPTNLIDLRFTRVVAGSFTTTAASSGITHVAGQQLALWFERVGGLHRMKLALATDPEPAAWTVSKADTTFGSGLLGIRHVLVTGNTSTLPVTVTHDNFTVTSPTQVRLDLNDDLPWRTLAEGTEFGTPPLRRAVASTLMQDGEHVSAAAYGNRMLTLTLDCQLPDTDFDGAATAFQTLSRELDRPGNFLRYRPGTTQPVFFRTLRSDFNSVVWDAVLRRASVSVLAEPFAYGLRETLPSVTVYNDPAEGTTLNANPFFETTVSPWTGQNGTVARSTAQFHEGVASLLLTPTGGLTPVAARSEAIPVTVGLSYRASAWMYSPLGWATGVSMAIDWLDSGSGLISTSLGTVTAISAGVWTKFELTATAPAGSVTAQFRARMAGTPAVTDLLYVDEARLRQSGGVGGMCFDVTGVKGDVEAPLYLTADTAGVISGTLAQRRKTALAVRRRGTPSQVPFVLQCESMIPEPASDTTVSSAATGASGGSHMRTTFATTPQMFGRFGIIHPASPSVDARGTYRVFVRVRQTVASDVIAVRLFWGPTVGGILGDTVTLPTSASTTWKYVDLGLIQIPVGYADTEDGVSGAETLSGGIGITLNAQRVSGSGSLDSDVMLILPADDRLLLLTWPATALSGAGADSFVIDSHRGEIYGLGPVGERVPTEPVEPEGGFLMVSHAVTNRIYFARDVGWETSGIGTTGPGDDITGTVSVGAYYWPRHITTRPTS